MTYHELNLMRWQNLRMRFGVSKPRLRAMDGWWWAYARNALGQEIMGIGRKSEDACFRLFCVPNGPLALVETEEERELRTRGKREELAVSLRGLADLVKDVKNGPSEIRGV